MLTSSAYPRASLPAAVRRPDGTPRYTLELPMAVLADAVRFADFQAELVGGGLHPEIRTFLDEELKADDVYVDLGAGWGVHALGAATCPAGGARTVCVVDDQDSAELLQRNAAVNHLLGTVTVEMVASLAETPVDRIAGTLLSERPGRVFLRVDEPRILASVLASCAELVSSDRLAAVVWRSDERRVDGKPTQSDRMMLEVMGAFGYSHFALLSDADGAVLAPLEASPTADFVFSLSAALLREQAVVPAAGGFASAGAEPLGIAGFTSEWRGDGFGALRLLRLLVHQHSSVPVILSSGPVPAELAADDQRLIKQATQVGEEILRRLPEVGPAPFPVLTWLRDDAEVPEAVPVRGRPAVGLAELYCTAFGASRREHLRGFDRLLVSSRWGADALRAAGIDRVRAIGPAVDLELFHRDRRQCWFGNRFVVFAGGPLSYPSAPELALRGFEEFRRACPEAILLFAWGFPADDIFRRAAAGPCLDHFGQPQLSDWLEENGVPSTSVIDLGPMSPDRVATFIREADVALFPFRCEAALHPLALGPIVSGIPTIVSANTGHLELIEMDLAIPLQRQSEVASPAPLQGVAGWGESSVDEIAAALERVRADGTAARQRASIAGQRAERLALDVQMREIAAALCELS